MITKMIIVCILFLMGMYLINRDRSDWASGIIGLGVVLSSVIVSIVFMLLWLIEHLKINLI